MKTSTSRRIRRIHRSPAEIRAILEAYRSSGLSQRAFAQSVGLPSATLGNWIRRGVPGEARLGRRRRPKPAGVAAELVPVRVVEPPPACVGVVELDLPGGRVLRVPLGSEPALLARYARALEDARC